MASQYFITCPIHTPSPFSNIPRFNSNVCCASGDFVGDTCCEGILDASGACCASGNVDCEGVCDGSAEVDCSGQCGGTKVEGRWGWGCCEPEQIAR